MQDFSRQQNHWLPSSHGGPTFRVKLYRASFLYVQRECWSTYLSIYLLIYLSCYLSICLSTYRSIDLSTSLSMNIVISTSKIYLYTYAYKHVYIHIETCICISICIYLSLYLRIDCGSYAIFTTPCSCIDVRRRASRIPGRIQEEIVEAAGPCRRAVAHI